MTAAQLEKALGDQMFPVATAELHPVTLPGRQLIKTIDGLEGVMFVIGSDDYSVQWAMANKEELAKWGATGILVECPDAYTYSDIKAQLAPLPLFALDGAFLTQIDVPGYPVMITSEGFFQ